MNSQIYESGLGCVVDFNKGCNFVLAKEDTGYFLLIKKIHLLAFSGVTVISCQRHICSIQGEISVLRFASLVLLGKYYTEGELLK